MGNLRDKYTEEEWDELESKALMSDDDKAKKAAIDDMEDEIYDTLAETFDDDYYLKFKKKRDE